MKKSSIIILLFVSLNAISQTFSGEFIYQYNKTIDWDSTSGLGLTDKMKEEARDLLKNQFNKTFILTVNNNKSLYKEQEKLQSQSNAAIFNMNFVSDSGKVFKDLAQNKVLEEKEFLGKKFLIADSIQSYNWELTKESKKIGAFTAFRAKAIIVVQKSNFDLWKKKIDTSKTKNIIGNPFDNFEVPNNIEIIAWYSPEIPIKNGPMNYGGLPGLILELNYGNIKILCTNATINQNVGEIELPKKGEIVTRSEFNEIVKVKLEELDDLFRNE
jgi:GLPGLI family protein